MAKTEKEILYHHKLFVPKHPQDIPADSEVERLERLERYWRYHRVRVRYGLKFKEFVAKVDAGAWDPYLAAK